MFISRLTSQSTKVNFFICWRQRFVTQCDQNIKAESSLKNARGINETLNVLLCGRGNLMSNNQFECHVYVRVPLAHPHHSCADQGAPRKCSPYRKSQCTLPLHSSITRPSLCIFDSFWQPLFFISQTCDIHKFGANYLSSVDDIKDLNKKFYNSSWMLIPQNFSCSIFIHVYYKLKEVVWTSPPKLKY